MTRPSPPAGVQVSQVPEAAVTCDTDTACDSDRNLQPPQERIVTGILMLTHTGTFFTRAIPGTCTCNGGLRAGYREEGFRGYLLGH